MLASGDRLSNCSTRMLATHSTMPAARIVMNVAYWPRLSSTSLTSALRFWPPISLRMRASRLRRARRNSAVSWKNPKLGIDPRRSSQPRWWMKYADLGLAPVML